MDIGIGDIRIEGGRALIGDRLESTSIHLAPAQGVISAIGSDAPARRRIDADGLLVLPGIVDIHGDAFERQMMPRPGVDFAMDIALLDSDRQAVANGITTVFHGVTWSWERGLRGPENARTMLAGIERLRPRLAADTRFHLRHETFNLEAEPEILEWLSGRRIDLVAFNDHMPPSPDPTPHSAAKDARERANAGEGWVGARSKKLAVMVERSGLSREDFLHLVARVRSRSNEVPGSIERIAQAALAHGVPLLSHDDASPDQRRWFRALGCRLAEFPTTEETAREAAAEGDDIVLGAPNVVRGGSHIGWIDAKDMVGRGLCSVLASDYYYPAQLLAAFRLAAENVVPLHAAWALVSQTAATAAGLPDRGTIARGKRADLILVDAQGERPRVVATIVAGRVVHLVDAERIVSF
jgi:alpha-D-ribose 1-methylphosphonate 5-triphosphate diphosphatase